MAKHQGCIGAGMITSWSLGSLLSRSSMLISELSLPHYSSEKLWIERGGERMSVRSLLPACLPVCSFILIPWLLSLGQEVRNIFLIGTQGHYNLMGVHPSRSYPNLTFLRSFAIYKSNQWASNTPHGKAREGSTRTVQISVFCYQVAVKIASPSGARRCI